MLTRAIEAQWATEAILLGFDPKRNHPIEVPWSTVPGRSGTVGERSGTLTDLPALLDEDGTRTIMVVGRPESGKTSSTIYMLLSLLRRSRAVDDGPAPVPVIVPLCNWDPDEPLEDWLASQLAEQHTWLKAPEYGKDMPKRLVSEKLILPILDALDEIPGQLPRAWDGKAHDHAERERRREEEAVRQRRSVLSQIATGGVNLPGLILSSREAEFHQAAQGVVRQRDTVVVSLSGLGPEDIIRYIGENADNPDAEPWAAVLDSVRPGTALASALSTPLLLSLVTKVHGVESDRSDPRALLAFGDVDSLRENILLNFAPTRFKEQIGTSERKVGKLRRAEAMRWLATLSGRSATAPRPPIAWWEFSLLVRKPTRIAAGALGALLPLISVGLGIGGLLDRTGIPPAAAYPIGGVLSSPLAIALGYFAYKNDPPPPSELMVQISRDRWKSALKSALFVYAVAALVCSVAFGPKTGLPLALAFAIPVGSIYAFTTPDALPRATTPQSLLKRDFRVGYVFALAYGAPCLIVGVLIAEHTWMGIVFGVTAGLAGGLLYGLPWLLALQGGKAGAAAFVHYGMALALLALDGRLPWRTMAFLEEAHTHGILRLQAGGTYAWRHASIASSIPRWHDRRAPVPREPRGGIEEPEPPGVIGPSDAAT
ncbi:hypothetical protein [Glycomyces salinus]|uniref:hypothetical protein n=1 Tax=Glycomyces salinus TaxID=980294 RepID=UPI0018EDA083|nr:hypothetical protein [Glycomyces salinus]